MKPLHPQVRIVESGYRTMTLFWVELYDGDVWERTHSATLPHEKAEQHARWLSDVLEHARDAALEEAAECIEDEADDDADEHYAKCIRAMKGVRDA